MPPSSAIPALDIKVFVDFHRAQRGLIGKGKQGGNHLMYQAMAASHQHQIEIYTACRSRAASCSGCCTSRASSSTTPCLLPGASLNDIYLHQQERYRFDRYHQIHSPALTRSMVNYVDDVFPAARPSSGWIAPASPAPSSSRDRSAASGQRLRLCQYRFESIQPNDREIAVTPMVGLGKRGATSSTG